MPPSSSRPLSVWPCVAVGAAGAVVGLLPWLVTGAELPLQSLAADQTTAAMPFALLPLHQYFLTTIVALLVIGGAAAGIAARALRRRMPPRGALAVVSGMLLVQLIAVVQAATVTLGVLERSTRSAGYLAAVMSVVGVSLVMGVLVMLLIARAPVPGATIALSLAAIVSGSWLGTAFSGVLTFGPESLVAPVLVVVNGMPAVLVGAAIAWGGVHTVGRAVAAVVSLAALWIGPAFFTAVSAAAGTRVLAAYPAEMAQYGVQVFFSAVVLPEIVIPPIVVAVVVGAIGAAVHAVVRRGGSQRTGAGGGATERRGT